VKDEESQSIPGTTRVSLGFRRLLVHIEEDDDDANEEDD
jgi:hypothetical protein